jgi:hypothetical protein
MSDPATRAARRRAEWTGGKASSFEALERLDLDAWVAIPGSEKLGMVFEMWFEQSREATDEATPRLQRSVGGVRPRGR